MGFDAFGLPAENHALKTNTHPRDNTIKNMQVMRKQLENLGGMYDWDYTMTTCFPDYYKWTQWLFLQLFKSGLAYQKEAPVNWCDKCKTVLANEQVIGDQCERCDTVVERRNMKQWFLKITDYADKLLEGIDGLDWPNKTKTMQKNWIGKSVGAYIDFDDLRVFTTRPDTILGATFIAVAGDYPPSDNKEMLGQFTGKYVTNPATGKKIPVWTANYVLDSYGTGAVMGVPAYDDRDAAFAKKYKLPIVNAPFTDKVFGKPTTTYRLRDWSIGRQRYWGTPIPIIYCPEHGTVPVPESDLPVELPYIKDFKPKGASPLASVPEFVNCKCPICGKPSKREVDTMDTFVCSSWYFLRYPYATRTDVPFEKTAPIVNKYIGGAEHACMHLLYTRFITNFLYDKGLIKHREMLPSLVHQGMILAPDGRKMSKSKGNTITPDKYVDEFGSDILRLYMLFGFNYTDGGPWDEATLKSTMRFIERVEFAVARATKGVTRPATEDLLHAEATAIKSVRRDLENFSFNTAVARCMELLNAINAQKDISRTAVKTLVLLLAPMVPHIAEEFWEQLGEAPSIFDQSFPVENEKYLTAANIEIAVQVNSKIVTRITVPADADQKAVEKQALALPAVRVTLEAPMRTSPTKHKVVYVKNRLINFIASK
jgi:leucyl-tRNA synthetase